MYPYTFKKFTPKSYQIFSIFTKEQEALINGTPHSFLLKIIRKKALANIQHILQKPFLIQKNFNELI